MRTSSMMFYLPINCEPWAVGPVQRFAKGAGVGRNQLVHAYEQAVAEGVTRQLAEVYNLTPAEAVALFDPKNGPVQLEFYFARQIASYKGKKGQTVTRNAADNTNIQKSTEDALQGVLFKNDRHNVFVSTLELEQSKTVDEPFVIISICNKAIDIEARLDALFRGLEYHGVEITTPAMLDLAPDSNEVETDDVF